MIFDFNPVEFFISIGLFAVIVEIFFVPGLGLLFLGFGSFSTAFVIYILPNMAEYQYVLLGVLSILWFALLWKPLKYYLSNKKESPPLFGIVGRSVEVIESDIVPHKTGKVAWSGTIMNARLAENMDKKVPVGTLLEVVSIEGNILILAHSNVKNA